MMSFKIKSLPRRDQRGFTIIELMIATTVLSVLLLLASFGILRIGQIYYKGVLTTRTQDVARTAVEDISRTVQTGGNKNVKHIPPATPGSGLGVICIGQIRYTYVLNAQLITDGMPGSDQTKNGMWVDTIRAGQCQPISALKMKNDDNPSLGDPNIPPAPYVAQGRELLGANMRLVHVDVTNTTQGSVLPVRVNIKIAYGESDLTQPATTKDATCLSIDSGAGQYCATSELDTYVHNRL